MNAPVSVNAPVSGSTPVSVVLARSAPVWSPDRLDQLCRHFAAGLTAAESAALICGVSADAVTSKRVRLGLGARRGDPHTALACLLAGRRGGRAAPPPSFPFEPLPDMDGPLPPGARPARLKDRRRGQCAWPLGPTADPAGLFCCAPTDKRRSYCPEHDARSRRRP